MSMAAYAVLDSLNSYIQMFLSQVRAELFPVRKSTWHFPINCFNHCVEIRRDRHGAQPLGHPELAHPSDKRQIPL